MVNRRKKSSQHGSRGIGRVLIWLGVFLNIYMGLSLVFGERGLFNADKVEQAHARIQAEIQALQDENTRLSMRIEALQSDPDTIEQLARERLGLVKEGELVYEFVEPPLR
ncbi:MAG: septum formation initiator family protein [Nitrospiria bacterium]